jgi:cell division protein FtsI/penicillin-binding protein 2
VSRKRTQPNGGGRHALLLVSFLAAFALISVRLVWVQVVQAPALRRQASAQRLRDIELPPRRSTIYHGDGEPLAVSTAG